eukprot:SAG11_NODE_549_length_8592_cov_11.089721_6_plen_72_part_00
MVPESSLIFRERLVKKYEQQQNSLYMTYIGGVLWRKAPICPHTACAISGQVPCAAASATMGGTSVITLVPV